MSLITFKDFSKVNLKIGTILAAEEVEGKDKIFKLSIDLGEEDHRELLAGLKEFYSREELEGKQVIVVTNLEPKKIAGIESKGMILAAESREGETTKVSLIEPDKNMPCGSRIY
jgi:methionyl-tRNA synthetase